MTSRPSDLRTRVAELDWYHTFDLPGGVTTPGLFDHRAAVERLLLPDDLSGLRCLDAASADGFFAFELRRRGAAEVVSIDLDDPARRDWQGPPGIGARFVADRGRARAAFDLVHEVTGLDVERRDLSVYDLSPTEVGTFDLVFMGNVLLHLRSPQEALHAIRSVTRRWFVSYEAITLADTLVHPRAAVARLWDGPPASRWWTPNLQGHRVLIESAGFRVLRQRAPLRQPFGLGRKRAPGPVPRSLRQFVARLMVTVGVPSSCVVAVPEPISPSVE